MLSLETGWRSQTPLRPSCFCVPKFLFVQKLLQLCFCWFLGSLLLRHTQYSIFCFLSVTPVGLLRIQNFCTVGYLKMFEAWLGRTFDPAYDYTMTIQTYYLLIIYYWYILYTVICGYYTIWDFLVRVQWKITGSFIISCILLVRASLLLDPAAPTHQKAWFRFKMYIHYNQERNGVTSFKWIAIQDWLVLHSCGYSRTSRKVRSKLKQV